ncbi:5'-nucleotidase [Cellulomonas dongxiuzhuiae]|uniref:5'-nucleotidase C-terminal domain-containing protein n=1 Tax=Cellulomonas dongxiuzhuiae TaxID=2819979 RepID=A0ABX8GMR8_9CELL|nr:5'-nucleotidase [Cellulomonas dongxiuzhuiae]MBO3096230.1 5'-nucleotidase C-terminal domain-containing protein [Cellulomonas dongxiuzhuiae]QWC17487.1 5'-nucleotidase C-terminal domain-containing protein [Cellulomonas dongxiuzhuiae]
MHPWRSVVVALVLAGTLGVPSPIPPAAAAAEPGDALVGWVTASATRAFDEAVLVGGEVVLPGPVPGPDGGDVTRESALGNLVADAARAARYTPAADPQIGVSTPTALAADLLYDVPDTQWPPDPGYPERSRVTDAELVAVLPEPEELWQVTLTGARLQALLEEQWRTDTREGRPDLHLGLSANVVYTYDDTRPRGARVTSLSIDGTPVDPAAGYRLVVPASLLQGPDAFGALAGVSDRVATGRTDRDALRAALGQVATPDTDPRALGVSHLSDPVVPESTLELRLTGAGTASLGPAPGPVEIRLSGVELTLNLHLPRDGDPEGPVDVRLAVPAGVPAGPGVLGITVVPGGTEARLPVVVGPGRTATTLRLDGNGQSQVYGDLDPVVRVRASLTPVTAPGPVEFEVEGAAPVRVPVVDGLAEYRLPSTTPVGEYVITARYPGDAAYAPAQAGPVRVSVRPVVSGTTLTMRRPASWLPVVWVSDVRLDTGAQPTGRVELREGTRVVARARVVRGFAAGPVPALGAGVHRLVAVFVPDEPRNVLGSRSTAVTVPR